MKKVRFYTIFILSILCVFILSASINYDSTVVGLRVHDGLPADTITNEAWKAPAWADTIRNPLQVSSETIGMGEELYNMYCFACHGETGYGDGPAGGAMGVRPANFHDPNVIKQKDGALFWKLTNGKGNMPPFKEVLKEEQRWQLVVYLREFGKQQ